MDRDVLCEIRDEVCWITLNRPQVMNALRPSVLRGIGRGLDLAEEDPTVRCVVFQGNGPAFCAGADLTCLKDAGGALPETLTAFLAEVGGVFDRIEAFSRPTLAAIHGLALAGGLELVLCCDLVIAADSARLGDAHANYGLLPGGGSSVRLPRPTRAKYLTYTGEFMPAADLVEAGLVNQVVPEAELSHAVAALTAKLSTKSPLGLVRMKELIDQGLDQPKHSALRLEILASELHSGSFDM